MYSVNFSTFFSAFPYLAFFFFRGRRSTQNFLKVFDFQFVVTFFFFLFSEFSSRFLKFLLLACSLLKILFCFFRFFFIRSDLIRLFLSFLLFFPFSTPLFTSEWLAWRCYGWRRLYNGVCGPSSWQVIFILFFYFFPSFSRLNVFASKKKKTPPASIPLTLFMIFIYIYFLTS